MGKVNVWVKRALFAVLAVIAVIGLLLLGLTLFSHGHFHKDEEIQDLMGGLHFMYATAAVTLILVAIGVFGACKEKKWALIIFVVGMILSSLFLFGISIQSFALMSEIGAELQAQYQHLLPLSNASTVIVDDLNEIQKEFQCCGLDAGYQDWGENIPDSCVCDDDSVQKCVEPPAGSRFTGRAEGELIRIYADPCVPFLISHVKDVIKTTVNIIMGIILLLA